MTDSRQPWPITAVCILALSFALAECSTGAKLYTHNRHTTGQLDKGEFDSLKVYLRGLKSSSLRDTIIIKYELAHETCWNALDRQSEAYVKQVMAQRRNFVGQQTVARRDVSFFHLKEDSGKYNKIIGWDSTVKTDNGALRRWLFPERTVCGTSAIVLPNGNYVLVKSDSHFEALYRTKEQLEAVSR